MSITNNHKLPVPLFKALSRQRYAPKPGRISTTALIDAPLQRVLLMKYTDQIVEDASEKLWALLGTAVHKVIELGGSKSESEVKHECTHKSGAVLVTIGDYISEKRLIDWKVTSVWSFLLGGKATWEKQLNVVKYIYGMNGVEVEDARVYAILRDWQQGKIYENNYPQIPFQEVKIKLWNDEQLNNYVDDQVEQHLYAESLIDSIDNIPVCSPEERWQRPTTYAVKRPKIKRAVRVFEKENFADEFIKTQKDTSLYVEERAGIDAKCENYCICNKWCPYYKPNNEHGE